MLILELILDYPKSYTNRKSEFIRSIDEKAAAWKESRLG
jgi:hypothetical protein